MSTTKVTFPIMGVTYRGPEAENQVLAAIQTPDQYEVELAEDNANPFDRQAVRVLVDDMHVGYVPRGNAPDVRGWLRDGMVASVALVTGWKIAIELREAVRL